MELGRLKKLDAEEAERADYQAHLIARSSKRGERTWAIRKMYEDKIQLPPNHAYHGAGSLPTTLFLNKVTVVEIFPYKDPEAFYKALGISVPEVAVLLNEGIVRILIHSYASYSGLDYLDPLLSTKPPAYQTRGRAYLDAISPGQFEDFFTEGSTSKYLTQVSPTDYIGEPYEVGKKYPQHEIVRKTVWRYAAMCCLLSPEVMRYVIDLKREQAANYINELHTVFLHPITHAMLGNTFGCIEAMRGLHHPKYVRALDSIERIIHDDLKLPLPQRPRLADVLDSHNSGLANELSQIRARMLEVVRDALSSEEVSPEAIRADITVHLAALRNRLTVMRSRMKMAKQSVLLGVLAGGLICMHQGFPTLGTILFGTVPGVPVIISHLAKTYAKFFQPTLSHYWKLSDASRKLSEFKNHIQ